MKRRVTLTLILAVLSAIFVASANTIIPAPKSHIKQSGSFTITSQTAISYSTEELAPLAEYMSKYIGLSVNPKPQGKGSISIALDNALAEEAYRLSITNRGVEIVGGGYGGTFNGVQTLFQLLPSSIYDKSLSLPVAVECCKVDDAPRFPYRAFMLDVARTFMTKENILRYIDYIAYHKINTLHWHLTDSQGWRLEIKSHPELTQIGAFRGGDSPIPAALGKWDEKYGGYYTQEDIREIVAYARVRNVEIIPEVDLPGHSTTLTRVIPSTGCTTKDGKPRKLSSAVCASKSENIKLFDEIFAEVAALFPSRYIHIGGDEVKFSQWKSCPDCLRWMEQNGNADPRELQIYFMQHIRDILTKYNKEPIMWYFGKYLLEGAVVQGWQTSQQCVYSAEKGHPTIVMPATPFYLDMRQSKHEDGFSNHRCFDVRTLYSYDLAENGLTPKHVENVKGFECAFWSELFLSHGGDQSTDYIEYMTFPRLCALAELGWGKNGGAVENFYATLINYHYDRMSAMGLNYRRTPPAVKYEDGRLVATVDDKSTIYYSREGSSERKLYTKPIKSKHPEEYLFWSEYKGVKSFATADESHYRTIRPTFTFSSSVAQHKRYPYSGIERYKRDGRTRGDVKSGDWFLFEFAEPVKCRAIEFSTGSSTLSRSIRKGYLEVSKDGKRFERAGELKNGKIRLLHPKAIKAARLVSEHNDNGVVAITAPRIYSVK